MWYRHSGADTMWVYVYLHPMECLPCRYQKNGTGVTLGKRLAYWPFLRPPRVAPVPFFGICMVDIPMVCRYTQYPHCIIALVPILECRYFFVLLKPSLIKIYFLSHKRADTSTIIPRANLQKTIKTTRYTAMEACSIVHGQI